jgi:hypothetical protein
VRYADDSNISVRSARAGHRVLASVRRFFERRLQLTVHAAKSAVARPWRRTFLGFTCPRRRAPRRQGRATALQARTQEVRQWTCRTRGASLLRVVPDLQQSLDGWYASVRLAEVQSTCQALDAWRRRRLRCSGWQQWGRRRSRELRTRGVSQDLAWHTCQSAPARGAAAAARRWPSRYQDTTVIGSGAHAFIGSLVVDAAHRTAGYVPRLSGGVGGAGREASPYPFRCCTCSHDGRRVHWLTFSVSH